MNNENSSKDLDAKLQEILASVRKTVRISNMALSTVSRTSFMATYESEDGICAMAIKPNNIAILAAVSTGGATVYKADFVVTDQGIGERRCIFKCETEQDADEIWELMNDKMYAWSQGEIESVDVEL